MTNKDKTVAELLDGIMPSAYAVNAVSLLDDRLCLTKSDACYPLSIIERVFGPMLAELAEFKKAGISIDHLIGTEQAYFVCRTKLDHAEKENATLHQTATEGNEHIAALNALLVQKDIENANLSRAVAELTETKADFYRSGVADGRAQKDAELVETREALRLAHDHMRLYLEHYHAGQSVFDTIHAILTAAKKDVERTNFSIECKTDPNIRVFLHTSDGTFQVDADGKRERVAQKDAEIKFQARVAPWMQECFGAEISADAVERNHRFFEEATELVQACGMTASEAHQLVDYTFGRPVGVPEQETGGVMVTLAALCLANKMDMHECGEIELARISDPAVVQKIRAKQAAKPKHSPLPEDALQELADESQPVGMSISDAMSKVLAGDVGPHRITPGAVEEAYAKAREAIKRDPIEPGSERHFHILMATHNLHAVVGRDYRNVMGLCADVWRSAATEQAEPSVNEELFVVAQQHPSRPEVSMFTANAKVAEEYKRIGWTVLKIQRAEAAKKESGE